MKEWSRTEVVDLLKESAAIALHYYDNPGKELKQDHTIVTVADREIEQFLARQLNKPTQGSYLIGEETVSQCEEAYLAKALNETVWIVDPIDGTAPYANHVPTWGISICMANQGRLAEGALYLPATRSVYISDGKTIFFASNLADDWMEADLRVLEPPKTQLDETGLVSLSQLISKQGRFTGPNPVHSVCSCVYSLCQLLEGNYLAYLGTVKLWDLAAGWVMLYKYGLQAQLYSSRTPLGLAISQDYYQLNADAGNRWCATDHIIFAPTTEIIDFMIDNLEFPHDDS